MKLIKYRKRGGAQTVTESDKGPRSYSWSTDYMSIDCGEDSEGKHYTLELTTEQARNMVRHLINRLGEGQRERRFAWRHDQPKEWEAALDDLLAHYDRYFEEHAE